MANSVLLADIFDADLRRRDPRVRALAANTYLTPDTAWRRRPMAVAGASQQAGQR